MKDILFYLYLIKMSIRASMGKRGSFLIQAGLILANNFIFFSIWFIFFNQFRDIGGWTFNDMMVLVSIGTGSYGFMAVLFGGQRLLSKTIASGDLDTYLTQPKNVFLSVLTSQSHVRGWGHVFTSLILFFGGGLVSLTTLPVYIICLICATLIFTGAGVIVHSGAFWVNSIHGLAKKYIDIIYLLSHYPTNIYGGMLQIMMFTLIPAGIIGFLPVDLFRVFSWKTLLLLIASAAIFVSVAVFVFYRGLRRYESGNTFTIRS